MYPADFVQVLKYRLHLEGLGPKKKRLVITCCFNFRAVGNWKTSNKVNIFSLRYSRCMLYWFYNGFGLALCRDWRYAGLGVGNQAGASACAYMNISHNHRDRFDKLLIRPAGTCPCFWGNQIQKMSCFEHCQDNLEMILHEFVLENVETELLRKWKNQS